MMTKEMWEDMNLSKAENTDYEEGYNDGIKCGKLCASQQILDELEELLTKKKEEFKQKATEHPEIDYPEADAFWTGRSVSCHDLLLHIKELKKKYGVILNEI